MNPRWISIVAAKSAPVSNARRINSSISRASTHAETAFHPCGTCKMGYDEMSVVDGEGRVHGLEGLRVVDASIMPQIITGNLNATTVMIGEKISGYDSWTGSAAEEHGGIFCGKWDAGESKK